MAPLAAYAVSRGDGQPLHRFAWAQTSNARPSGEIHDFDNESFKARGAGERFPSGGRRGRQAVDTQPAQSQGCDCGSAAHV